ncbi:MAG: phytanoyl-CoA dioxygenase family protein, partial [Alphaproteobacteria bacterium]|nr:phytanoyl-CoA dioxygenase family protein [Alphaproteobacteria bacterium]
MTPDAILACKPKALSQKQREAFFEDGFLALDSFVEQVWLDRLWQVTQDFIEESRTVTESNGKFDLEPDHTSEKPRLRRLSWPVTQHEIYWEFASHSPIVDVAEDLLGPDVVFHHSKLNFKWSGGGEEVKWHQDFPFYPHSNRAHLAIGLCLSDV